MNEKPDPRTLLVTELFEERWMTGAASGFARAAAAHARRRRAGRHIAVGTSGAALLMAAAFFGLRTLKPGPVLSPPARAEIGPKRAPLYEIISDEQLMVELRGRPLLIL